MLDEILMLHDFYVTQRFSILHEDVYLACEFSFYIMQHESFYII